MPKSKVVPNWRTRCAKNRSSWSTLRPIWKSNNRLCKRTSQSFASLKVHQSSLQNVLSAPNFSQVMLTWLPIISVDTQSAISRRLERRKTSSCKRSLVRWKSKQQYRRKLATFYARSEKKSWTNTRRTSWGLRSNSRRWKPRTRIFKLSIPKIARNCHKIWQMQTSPPSSIKCKSMSSERKSIVDLRANLSSSRGRLSSLSMTILRCRQDEIKSG